MPGGEQQQQVLRAAGEEDSSLVLLISSPHAWLHYTCFALLLSVVATTLFNAGVAVVRKLRRKRGPSSLRRVALGTRQSLFDRLPLFWSPTYASTRRQQARQDTGERLCVV